MTRAKKEVKDGIEISIVLPCLNEELTVGTCVTKALAFLKTNSLCGEVIIADNGSRLRGDKTGC